MTQASTNPSSAAPPAPQLATAIQYLNGLTGLDFHLAPDRHALVYEGTLPIPAFHAVYFLNEQGAVNASINYPLGKGDPKISITALDMDKLAQLHADEAQRRERGQLAAQLLTKTTGHIWGAGNDYVFTAAPAPGDPLYPQLQKLQEYGVFQDKDGLMPKEFHMPDGASASFISLYGVDVSRLRTLAPLRQEEASRTL